jgi:hypothetical protein
MSQIIDVYSDEIANDVDFVTPPAEVKNQWPWRGTSMNLFNVVAQFEGKKHLRKVKIEKEWILWISWILDYHK